MTNNYAFAAIRGVQAGLAFYVVMMPLKTVVRVLSCRDDLAAGPWPSPRLKKRRVNAIARYLLSNPDAFFLPALVASIDGGFRFEPAGEHRLRSVGTLFVDINAALFLSDGGHRHAAIAEALRERPSLGNETIAITIIPDAGLDRAGQMFVDLNRHIGTRFVVNNRGSTVGDHHSASR